MEGEFLQQRHAAYRTPEATLFALVRQATGQEATERQQIVAGYDNEVYCVRTQREQEFIVRIRQHGETPFEQEAWAIEQCRAAGVPVPDVLFITTVPLNEQSREVMVQRRVPGRPLSAVLSSLPRSELASIFEQAAEALGRIHSVHVGGFYKRHGDGRWDFATWEQFMQSHQDNRRQERRFLLQAGLTEAEIKTILVLIERYGREFDCPRPVLCHGDFEPKHLFFSEDHILTGIIDFGEFQGGAPIADLASLYAEYPEIDLQWLRSGYSDASLFDTQFSLRLLLHTIGFHAGYLAYSVQQRNRDEMEKSSRTLRATLKQCQHLFFVSGG